MIPLVEFLSRLARCAFGSALVEATIYVPIAISLMVGGVDFGRAFFADATVGKSVRDAARYLASLPIPPTNPTRVGCSTWAIKNAKYLAVYGKVSPNDGDPALISGWMANFTSGITVPDTKVKVDCSDASKILVRAHASYIPLMLGAVLPGIGTLSLSAQHEEQAVGG
jgi:hypothetical protein